MKLIEPKITILIDGDGATMEVHDGGSATTFVRVVLTTMQLCQALGRLSYTDCQCEVF